jgi:thioredoxin reductase
MKSSFEYLIIGAGPAGLQLGYFLEKTGQDYCILEGTSSAGAFFKEFPRHRNLLSINKIYTGYDDPVLNQRWDWNSLLTDDYDLLFKDYSKRYFPDADDMVRYCQDYAKRFDLAVTYDWQVARVTKENETFIVEDADGNKIKGRRLIVGTGVPKPYIPDIKGIEHAENYTDIDLNPENFTNQRVLIIGKGNTAFEMAESLVETTAAIHMTSRKPLKLAWTSHHVGHLRAINNNILDTYLLKAQNAMVEAHTEAIRPREDGKFDVDFRFTRAHDLCDTMVYDRIINCAGFAFDNSIFDDSCKPELVLDGRFPDQTSQWESTNVPNLFFIGTLMQARDFKKTQSSFVHGFRYNIRAFAKMISKRFHGGTWPRENFVVNPDSLSKKILDRINRGSALWHQPGFLCDVCVLEDGEGQYFSEIPVAYWDEGHLGKPAEYFRITLEYGPDHPDFPFEFNRYTDAENAHKNPQLHPIIRHFIDGKLEAEHHILEETEGIWVKDVFIQPLLEFLKDRLAMEAGLSK